MFLMDLEMSEVHQDDYEEFGQNWLTANRSRLAPKTTGRRLTALRQFAQWAGWGVMFDDYSPPTPLPGQPHPLPEGIEGVRRMVAVCNDDRHAALVVLCGMCGLRVAEALAVRPSDFDLHQMMLTVNGKGSKWRQVPVSTEAWEVLAKPVTRAFCEGNAPVVGIRDRFARSLITRLGVRAGLRRKVASHDLRATFATEVYNKTLDQRLVQKLLGHSSGTTTEIYIGVSQMKMKEGVEL
jgi:site-specific recombinase XerD